MALVHKFDEEFPDRFFPEFLDYISHTEESFHATVDSFRSPHLWGETDTGWKLRHAAWH